MYTLTAAILSLSLLCGCGAKSQAVNEAYMVAETAAASMSMAGAAADYAREMPMAEPAYEEEEGYSNGVSGAGQPAAAPTEEELSGSNLSSDGQPAEETDHGRKLIRNVDVSLQTLEFDKVTDRIKQTVKTLGGYIENSGTYGGSYYGGGRRSSNITARIPQEKLDYFLDTALADATVISMNENTEDITLRYSDLESKVEALNIEYDRLTELLTKADSIESVIALESRLSEVRYELESIRSSLKSYDNRVTYSTVYLYIEEVEIITPAKKATFGEKITTGFAEGTRDFVEGLEEFAVWFISNIFSLLLTAIIIFAVVKIGKKIRNTRKNRPAKEKKPGKKLFAGKNRKTEMAVPAADPLTEENNSTEK